MFETVKHTLGICGEPHPSVLWLISSGGLILYYLKHNISWCWKQGCNMCKEKIRRKLYDYNMGTQKRLK